MSELHETLRLIAMRMRVLDPEREWAKFIAYVGDGPISNPERRWEKWCERARKQPPPERVAPSPNKLFVEPPEWEAARRADPHFELGRDACQTILANLDAMGGKPSAPAKPAPVPGPVDPLCACGRLASDGASSLCTRCKTSGAPTQPAAEKKPAGTLAGEAGDVGDFANENEDDDGRNQDESQAREDPFGGL